jgi:hypothetical protein
MEAAATRGAYGNFSAQDALYGARGDVMWERFTGANLGNIQSLSGLAMRYGGDKDAIQSAYAGLTASGMGKGQFDEFLTGMQRIMEDGIEKGFVKGAEEIAGNMSLLSKLSGDDPLWTGGQGANRLMRMNEAISGATALKSVEDVLSFGVAQRIVSEMSDDAFREKFGTGKTGTYVDSMMLLNRGFDDDLLKGQFEAVRNSENGNVAGQIERFMKMFRLGDNYIAGEKIYQMANQGRDWSEIKEEIKKQQINPDMKSDSQRYQDLITENSTIRVNIGKFYFDDTELPKLVEGIAKGNAELESLSNKHTLSSAGTAAAAILEHKQLPLSSIISTPFFATGNLHNLDGIEGLARKDNRIGTAAKMFIQAVQGIEEGDLDKNLAEKISQIQRTFNKFSGGNLPLALGIGGDISNRENDQIINLINELKNMTSSLKEDINATRENTASNNAPKTLYAEATIER